MVEELGIGIAFAGGVISFFSPCILPLIPAYMSHLAGVSLKDLEGARSKGLQMQVFRNSAFFVIGFSFVFIALGSLLGLFGQAGAGFQIWLGRVGGTVIIVLGLHTIGLLSIPYLEVKHGMDYSRTRKASYFTSLILGGAFGVGWTPCVGPILAAIFVLAGTSASAAQGALLLTIYSLGLALPFLITGLFTGTVSKFIRSANKYFGVVNIVSGVLLIILGIVVFTNNFQRLIAFIQ